jgi:hypothetical protein
MDLIEDESIIGGTQTQTANCLASLGGGGAHRHEQQDDFIVYKIKADTHRQQEDLIRILTEIWGGYTDRL